MTGHGRDGLQRGLQPLAAAREDEVDDAVLRRELGELLAPAAGDEADRAVGDAGLGRRLGGDRREHGVRVRRRGRAAQDDRVAGLQAQRGGVDRDVRARLVDDGDDAERHAQLAHVEAVGQALALDDLADRVGQRGDRARAGGDRGDPRRVEREAVEQRARRGRSRGRPAMSRALASTISSVRAISASAIACSAAFFVSVSSAASARAASRASRQISDDGTRRRSPCSRRVRDRGRAVCFPGATFAEPHRFTGMPARAPSPSQRSARCCSPRQPSQTGPATRRSRRRRASRPTTWPSPCPAAGGRRRSARWPARRRSAATRLAIKLADGSTCSLTADVLSKTSAQPFVARGDTVQLRPFSQFPELLHITVRGDARRA